jgi:O-antigen chain-terminating methyltransferase
MHHFCDGTLVDDSPDIQALRRRLEDEEAAYGALLDAIDRLAAFPLPAEKLPDLPAAMQQLNARWRTATPPDTGGMTGRLRRLIWSVAGPAISRQQEFNSTVVEILNGHVDESTRLFARLKELTSALVQYLQRVQPLMDARDRWSSGLAVTRSELILEAFDRRQESLGRRVEGLLALRDRLETVSETVRAVEGALASPPPAPVAAAAARAAEDATYVAFENRFRGTRDEIRERLRGYVEGFRGLAPVADLGCGRGEFLELLREANVDAVGAETNAQAAAECRRRGLAVEQTGLLEFLSGRPAASLGGVFAAQVAEHLPPAVLQAALRESHRALRPGGLLVLETVNTRSVLAFLEVYNRDLTHEKPLHSETLSFLVAAAGFTDVRVELRSPVDASTRLQPVPGEGLPAAAAEALNENVSRLNALLYGPQEYALIARR